jgi:pimeloyl-ACP methyl ester carboxylesterase
MEKYAQIESPGGVMRGMINYPESGNSPFPTLVILHGFRGNRMGSESLFVTLSRFLATKGCVSVRFDFTGSGESGGRFADTTVSGQLSDALLILGWTAIQPEVDPLRIAILGHSMGGSIAGLLAGLVESGKIGQPGARPKTLILLAPAGEIRDRINEEIARRGFPATLDSPDFDHLVRFPIVVGGELLEKKFFADLRKYNVMEASGPITVIQDADDHAVHKEVAFAYSEKIPGCTIRMIRGAGHKFSSFEARAFVFFRD